MSSLMNSSLLALKRTHSKDKHSDVLLPGQADLTAVEMSVMHSGTWRHVFIVAIARHCVIANFRAATDVAPLPKRQLNWMGYVLLRTHCASICCYNLSRYYTVASKEVPVAELCAVGELCDLKQCVFANDSEASQQCNCELRHC